MKIIHMQDTIQLMSRSNPKEVEQLIGLGHVTKLDQDINYLVTTIHDGDSIVPQQV